ncbi:MAG TPA: PKD domain-containing protein [Chitinophagales bacterium]|nr:PKD domain-containing protein [Chitinophagales bacterium]
MANATPARKQITLNIQDLNSSLQTQTVVYFDVDIATAFAMPEDQQITFDTSAEVPQIFSYSSDNVACYSNGYGDFSATTTVALGVKIGGGSTYTFSQHQLYNFDGTTIVQLEDRELGVFTDLRMSNYTVQINSSGIISNRFYLHISYPPTIQTIPAGCTDDDGFINVQEDSSIRWNSVKLYNSDGHFLYAYNNATGDFSYQGLSEGSYRLDFVYQQYVTSINIVLNGNKIVDSISASTMVAGVGEDINFSAITTNTDNITWDFGDGSVITGVANITFMYYETGTYTVTLTCTNSFGCTSVYTITVVINPSTGITQLNGSGAKILTEGNDIHFYTGNNSHLVYRVYNMAGQEISTGPVTQDNYVVSLNNQAAGVYIVNLRGEGMNYTRKLFIQP